MEMYNTSDYLRVNPVYKVRAVEANTMSVDPDKKEERRREERKHSAQQRKEKKASDKTMGYNRVYQQEAESHELRPETDKEKECSPYLLWLHMKASQGRLPLAIKENAEADQNRQKLQAQQEMAVRELSEQSDEGISFDEIA
ncbi:MAG: hypothetical protein SOX11_10570 [Lachnospiraceae bacterium]|nr:hypothetical protein [Lachnospiraceae bacterium]MDY3223570.1 hypothetical protein [Lachnospiraceae bacterium]